VATSSARSTFNGPSPDIREHYAGNLDWPFTRLRKLAVHHGKSATNQLGQYIDLETIREESRSGAACLSCVGKQFEGTPLFSAELLILIQNAHRTFLRETPHRRQGMILFRPIVRTRPDIAPT
jgi:hypothetical protein